MRSSSAFLVATIVFLLSCNDSDNLEKKSIDDATARRDSVVITNDTGVYKLQYNQPFEIRTTSSLGTPYRNFYKDIIFPALALLIPVGIFSLSIVWKRRDEKRNIRLKRLEDQINSLYGPLFTWYEIGNSNFQAYLQAGYYASFSDPHYLLWLDEVFSKTNENIEKRIIENSGLFIGKLPIECVDFCQHMSVLKACIAEAKSGAGKDGKKISFRELDNRMEQHPHPTYKLEAYIKVGFRLLKDQQSKLLSRGSKATFYNEKNDLSHKTEAKLKITAKKRVLTEKEIHKFIQKYYPEEAHLLAMEDKIREQVSVIPFDAERRRDKSYAEVIRKAGIQYEKIYHVPVRFGKPIQDEKFLAEKITYDREGRISNICFFYSPNRKYRWMPDEDEFVENDTLLFRANYSYKQNNVSRKKFYDSYGNLISSASFEHTDETVKVIYYGSRKLVEFRIEVQISDNKEKLWFLKYDNGKNLTRVILADTGLGLHGNRTETYNWHNPKNYDTDKKCLKIDKPYWERKAETNQQGNIIKTTDKDIKSGQTKIIHYVYPKPRKHNLIETISTRSENLVLTAQKEYKQIPYR